MDKLRWVGLIVVVGWSASCSSSSEEPEPGATSGDEQGEEQTLHGHMSTNFDLALKARDGIIAGSLVQAHEAALKITGQDYSTILPPDWMPGVQRMQAAAREVTAAPDLAAGAKAVATMAQTCGDCHASFAQGDRGREVEGRFGQFGVAEDMHQRMMRHERAADGFWFGLTIPSDTAWQSGAQALLDAPATPLGKDGKPVSQEMVARLDEVRALARHALEVTDPNERVTLYAQFLSTCSSCHQGK